MLSESKTAIKVRTEQMSTREAALDVTLSASDSDQWSMGYTDVVTETCTEPLKNFM